MHLHIPVTDGTTFTSIPVSESSHDAVCAGAVGGVALLDANLAVLELPKISSPTSLTLTANTIAVSRAWHSVNAASGTAAQRSLRIINGGCIGQFLILQKDGTSPGVVVIDDNAGNIQSAGNFTLTNVKDKIGFLFDGTHWCELFRSNNAA